MLAGLHQRNYQGSSQDVAMASTFAKKLAGRITPMKKSRKRF